MALILFSILLYRRTYPLRIIRFKTLEKRFTIMALSEKEKREISRQKYFTAFALVLMLIVIVVTYVIVG